MIIIIHILQLYLYGGAENIYLKKRLTAATATKKNNKYRLENNRWAKGKNRKFGNLSFIQNHILLIFFQWYRFFSEKPES